MAFKIKTIIMPPGRQEYGSAIPVFVELECDTAADLPTSIAGYDMQTGSTAHDVSTNEKYAFKSNGTWVKQIEPSLNAYYTKAETDAAIENAVNALDVASVGGSGKYIQSISEVDGKIIPIEETMDTVPTSGSQKAITSDAVHTPLAELIDSGAKNRIRPVTSGSATSRGIVFTYNSDGTIAVSGQNDRTGDSNATYRTLQGDFSGYVISGTSYGGVIRILDADTNSVIVSINSATPAKVIPQNSASSIKIQLVIPQGSTDTGFILYPMICSKAAWDISQKYVPYCPTMAELYQMILSTQNRGRSNSLVDEDGNPIEQQR